LAQLATLHKSSYGLELLETPGWQTLMMVLKETGERPPKRPNGLQAPEAKVHRRYRPDDDLDGRGTSAFASASAPPTATAAATAASGRTLSSAFAVASPGQDANGTNHHRADENDENEDEAEVGEEEDGYDSVQRRGGGGSGSGVSQSSFGDEEDVADDEDDEKRPTRILALPNRRRYVSATEHLTKRVKGFRLD
jgi:hypothetical protein